MEEENKKEAEEEDHLYEEGGVELADGDLVLVAGRRHQAVQNLLRRPLPDLLHDVPELEVALVDGPVHLDLQAGADHSEQGGAELNRAVRLQIW